MVPVEYTGPTMLIVRGPRTGRVYRFRAQGMVLPVDRRDAAHLGRIAGLRCLAAAPGRP